MGKNKNIKNKLQSGIKLFGFLYFLLSSTISSQIFIGENAAITNSEDFSVKVSSKHFNNSDSLKPTAKIYVVKGTKIFNLKENTNAAIAYIPVTKKDNNKSLAKNSIKKQDKLKVNEKKIPVVPAKYKYTTDSHSYFSGNISELKVIPEPIIFSSSVFQIFKKR